MTATRVMFAASLALACSDPRAARTALQKAGFTEITAMGWAPWSCGEGDVSSTGFIATNPIGERVEGVVCCGVLKGCTVRF